MVLLPALLLWCGCCKHTVLRKGVLSPALHALLPRKLCLVLAHLCPASAVTSPVRVTPPADTFTHTSHVCHFHTHLTGALGGRLDHTLANLNALYTFSNIEVVLMGDGNLVRLLPSGTTTIRPHALEGPSCGLVPLAAPAVASSSGLRWNLDDTQVGGRTRAAEATGQGVDVYMLYALPPGPDTYDTMCVGNDFVA